MLATQTLRQTKAKTLRVNIVGATLHGVTAKDIIMALVGHLGSDGAVVYAIEHAGAVT